MHSRDNPNCATATKPRDAGFTLVELMIVVVVVAILAVIAVPSYLDSVRKSRRSDAVSALVAVQQGQERWRANQPAYASNDQLSLGVSATPPGLGVPSATANGYYTVSISGESGAGYTATATAVTGKSQVNDGNCAKLRVRVADGNVFFGSTSASETNFDESSSNRCWAR